MGELIIICESCRNARARFLVEFPPDEETPMTVQFRACGRCAYENDEGTRTAL